MTTTQFLGAGVSQFGTTYAGTGTPIHQSYKRRIWKDQFGNLQNARMIDPITMDYVFNEFGYSEGMSDIQQQVYLALITAKNSSIILTLGLSYYNTQVIGTNYQYQIEEDVNQALYSLIKDKKVLLNSVEVKRNSTNQLIVDVKWTDLTKQLAFSNII